MFVNYCVVMCDAAGLCIRVFVVLYVICCCRFQLRLDVMCELLCDVVWLVSCVVVLVCAFFECDNVCCLGLFV